jgi:AsmA protein
MVGAEGPGSHPRAGVRIVRWSLAIAGALVLLAVAALLLAMMLVNPDRYRGKIESTVRNETGRPFVLEGHLQLTWFPWLGVRTGAARLGNPPGESGPDLIQWQSAQVRVRLLPLLLHRELEVSRIRVVGANIHLRRGPQGGGNWDNLIASLHTGRVAKATPTPAAASGSAPATAPATTWAGLDLEDCSLDYIDERSGEHVSLTDWQLSVGPWRSGEPLSARTQFLLHGQAARSSAWRLPPAGVRVSLDLPRLEVHDSPMEVAAPRFSLRIGDAKLEGAVDARPDTAGQLTASGSLDAAVPSLRELIGTLGIDMTPPRDPSALGALSLSGRWSYRDGALAVNPLALKLDQTALSGWVTRSAGPGSPWTFALRADDIDLGRYLTGSKPQKPLELPVQALQSLHAQGTVELGRARIDGTVMKDLRLQVQ